VPITSRTEIYSRNAPRERRPLGACCLRHPQHACVAPRPFCAGFYPGRPLWPSRPMQYNKSVAETRSPLSAWDACTAMDVNTQIEQQPDLYPLHVVILNWNLPNDTIACVRSLHAAAQPGIEIVIVDNASTDDSLQRFREQFGDTVTVIANRANLG